MTISKIRPSLERLNSRSELAEERISTLEERSVEITHCRTEGGNKTNSRLH